MNQTAASFADTSAPLSSGWQWLAALRQIAGTESADSKKGYEEALAPLLDALGWQGDVRQFCDALPCPLAPFSSFDLLCAMAYFGYTHQQRTLPLSQIDASMLPCLVTPATPDSNQPHWQVILEITERGWLCQRPDHEQPSLQQPNERMVKACWFERLQPDEDSATLYARTKTGFTWFRGVMARFQPLLWQVGLIGFVVNLVALAVPLFVMMMYDRVIGARALDTLPYLTAGVLIAIILEAMLRYVRLHALAWLGARINAIVSVAIFERLLFLSPAYTERASVPSQLARLRAFEMVRDFFGGPAFLALLEAPFILILMLTIGLIAGPLVLVGIVVGLIYLAMLVLLRRQIVFHIHRASRSLSEKQQAAVELFTRLDDLKLSGVTEPLLSRFSVHSARASLAQFRSHFMAACIEHLSQALSMLAGVATLAFGVDMIWDGSLSIGALVATMILTWRMLSPLQTLCAMLPRLEHIRNSIEQVNRLMTIRTERDPDQLAQSFSPLRGEVSFSHVSLRYSRVGDPVFANLSFTLKAGQTLCIIGGNGSGKSSVLKLLAGLYIPQTGHIRIDDTDIRQFDPMLLRRHISYVPQHAHLFGGSVAEQLRLIAPLADDAALSAALAQAGAWEAVQSFRGGLYHMLDASDHLPPDLLLRLELAQLYLAPQKLIACDELPASLIAEHTGRQLIDFLREQKGERTTLLVSHHREWVALADEVLWLRRDQTPRRLSTADALKLLEEDAW